MPYCQIVRLRIGITVEVAVGAEQRAALPRTALLLDLNVERVPSDQLCLFVANKQLER